MSGGVLPGLDTIRPFLADSHEARITPFAQWAARELMPRAEPESDAVGRVEARALVPELAEAGAFEAIREQDARLCCLLREVLAAASPLADAVFALQALGTTPVLRGASDAARERFAEPALRGEAMAAFAITEPEAGSDVASIATQARRDGADWILDGSKIYISNGGIADFYVAFASTSPGKGGKGITAFAVPADSVRLVRPLVMSAPHPLGEIAFDGCRVPDELRLSPVNDGYRLALSTLDRLRSTVAAAACGMARRALDEALAHVTTRRQFGKPLAEFQLVQQKLSRMATELDAARLLTYRAAAALDGGAERVTREAAMAKWFATEAAQRIVDDAAQLLGGRGTLADHPVDRLYRSVRALRIYEGTTDVQHLIVAGQVIRDHRA